MRPILHKRSLLLSALLLTFIIFLVHYKFEFFQVVYEDAEEDVNLDGIEYLKGTDELLSDNNPHLFKFYTVTLVPINSGMLHLFKNMLCSLARINPSLTSHITAWAMNKRVISELHHWRIQNELLLNDTGNLPVHGFGIFHDPKYTGVGTYERGGTRQYWKMMKMRKGLYVDIVQKRNLLFMDADIVYFVDPYLDTGLSHNFPNHSDRAENLSHLMPDLVYSVDPRDHYRFLDDPYEGHKYVPVVCGGFFYARSATRTVDIFKKLHKLDDDEQHGMNVLLDGQKCNILIDPLPEGLQRRDVNREKCIMSDSIRLQVLDSRKYVNGVPWHDEPDHDQEVLSDMESRGEKRVMVHSNVWGGVDKKQALKDAGFWFLDDNEMCKPA